MIFGIFSNQKDAGDAVAELKNKGYTNDISIIAVDNSGNPQEKVVKADGGVAEGAAGGAVLGALAGIIAGITSVIVPGLGAVLIGGPILATWGITGAVLGALTGGLVGALTGMGIPEDVAKAYENKIRAGEVLVAVNSTNDNTSIIEEILKRYNAEEVTITS